jgi:opacity protein-like surface antigen
MKERNTMKFTKTTLSAALPLLMLIGTSAQALPFDQYLSVKGTVSRAENKFDAANTAAGAASASDKGHKTIAGGTLAYGFDFAKSGIPVRTEIESGWSGRASVHKAKSAERMTAKFEKKSLLINGYYDFRNSTRFTPYVGAGAGVAGVKAIFGDYTTRGDSAKNITHSKTKTNFAWQGGLGATFAATRNVALDAGYRYVDYGSVKQTSHGTSSKIKAREHQLYAGVRYTFI